ncbi:MAG: hypothetical protein AAF750_07035 [Planctomycetota bacterium]
MHHTTTPGPFRPLTSLAGLLLGLCLLPTTPALAEDSAPATQPATPPTSEAAPAPTPKSKAQDFFTRLQRHALRGQPDDFKKLRLEYRQHVRHLSSAQKRAVAAMARDVLRQKPPTWWKNTRSSTPVSFKAEIWDKRFTANYKPTDTTGVQALSIRQTGWKRTRNGYEPVLRLDIIVSWRPKHIDSDEPAEGLIAKSHGYTQGDLAEVIVWHELGHNYLSAHFSIDQTITLYTQHEELYVTLQEFFADMTAVAHAGHHARRAAMQMRLFELDQYDDDAPHNRGSHGVGAIFIHDVLNHPDKWPSVRLPPAVPKQQIELNTIIYAYENWAADWSFAEAVRLQKLMQDYVKRNGETTFRRKGEITLPNRLEMQLMVSDDRDHQKERDAWVAKRLQQLIAQGRTDKLAEGETYDPPRRKGSRGIDFDDTEENGKRRLRVPTD